MAYTLTQAAEATGISKSTILRAIKSNKVSATRDERNQGWIIEPAELHRLYPPVANDAPAKPEMMRHDITNELSELRVKLEAATQRIADKDDTIADLRRRLDAEGEERRKLTAILTDQRAKAPDVIVTQPPARNGDDRQEPAAAAPAPVKKVQTPPALKPPPTPKKARRWWQRRVA